MIMINVLLLKNLISWHQKILLQENLGSNNDIVTSKKKELNELLKKVRDTLNGAKCFQKKISKIQLN